MVRRCDMNRRSYGLLCAGWVLMTLGNTLEAKSWTKEEIVAKLTGVHSSQELGKTRGWGSTRSVQRHQDRENKEQHNDLISLSDNHNTNHANDRNAVDMDIPFEFGSAVLGDSASQQLSVLAGALHDGALSHKQILIVGHTDQVGDEKSNQALSTLRASAVFNYLTNEAGVNPERLYVQGMGANKLKNVIDPYASENRRVEIVAMP